jgi:hypothetical protein
MERITKVWRGFSIIGKIVFLAYVLGTVFIVSGVVLTSKKFMEIQSGLNSISSSLESIKRSRISIEEDLDGTDGSLKEMTQDLGIIDSELQKMIDTVTEIQRTLCERGLTDCRRTQTEE